MDTRYIDCPGDDRIFAVVGDFDPDTPPVRLKGGKGYVFPDGHVRLYSLTKTPRNPYPYFYYETENPFTNKGKYVIVEGSPEYEECFEESKIVSLSVSEINLMTPPDYQPFNEEAVNAMNAAAEKFQPVINPTDDPLKKTIKAAIIEKQINISRLNADVDRKCRLNNMKSALTKETRMSADYFVKWCELLGLDFRIEVLDNGTDRTDPLKQSVTYKSELDSIVIGEDNPAPLHRPIKVTKTE